MPVESALAQLAALQNLDQQLREKMEQLEGLRARLSDWRTRIEARRESAAALQKQFQELDGRRRDLERRLAEEDAKMRDRRMRLQRVRNEKEAQALHREIELGKQANQQLESDLLQLLEALETLQKELKAAEEDQQALENEFREDSTRHEVEIQQLAQEIERIRAERAQLAMAIDASLLRRYEQIFQRREGLAVVEIQEPICKGCHMNLSPQFFIELQRGDEIRLCPNCHRILYFRVDRAGEDG
ncbi:MAG: C4-type zinc ribbon domain-containing protein [Candidatus Binatia bacterium]|nr:C4-type zinc ribbon domain-containing protein [Candidatus Binatia bacterium]